MRVQRAGAALALALTAVATIAAPVPAAGATHWVDDDGQAGPSGCGGTATAATQIQAAIDDAGAGDTVRVCPGDYEEALRIPGSKDGLTLIGTRPWDARVLQPEDESGNGSSLLLVRPGANDVTVQWLSFIARPPLQSVAGDCQLDTAIWVRGKRAEIRANRISVDGPSYQPCGLYDGIRVGEPLPEMTTAGEPPPASARVSHNAVRDFINIGIGAIGEGVRATIQRNSVRYWHLDGFPGTAAVQRIARSVSGPWDGMAPAGPGPQPGYGIAMGLGAQGDIYGNEVSSGKDAVGPVGGPTPLLFSGVVVGDTSDVQVRQNTVRRAYLAFAVFGVDDSLWRRNVAIDHQFGISLTDSDDNTVGGNQVGPGWYGIVIEGFMTSGVGASSENTVQNNTSIGHELDCGDATVGDSNVGTLNRWVRNTGIYDDPSGLCEAD